MPRAGQIQAEDEANEAFRSVLGEVQQSRAPKAFADALAQAMQERFLSRGHK